MTNAGAENKAELEYLYEVFLSLCPFLQGLLILAAELLSMRDGSEESPIILTWGTYDDGCGCDLHWWLAESARPEVGSIEPIS